MFGDSVPVLREYLLTGQRQQPTGGLDKKLGEGGNTPSNHEDQRSLSAQNKSFVLLAMFEPWEVYEMACVRDFVMRRYAG